MGAIYGNHDLQLGDTRWDFDGQDIFKRAVQGMSHAAEDALARAGVTIADIDLVVPHQANLRIIEAVAKRAGVPMERVYVTVQRYGNMSAATVPVALVEALEEGRVKPGALSACACIRRRPYLVCARDSLGRARQPLGQTNIALPPCEKTGVELVQDIIRRKGGTTKGFDVQLPAK